MNSPEKSSQTPDEEKIGKVSVHKDKGLTKDGAGSLSDSELDGVVGGAAAVIKPEG